MIEYTKALELLSDCSIGRNLNGIYELFDSIKSDFDFFQQKYNIHCSSGCGECCAHFTPDVTKLEALQIAAYIRFSTPNWEESKSRLEFFRDNEFGYCPLYRDNTPYHCSVYEARPLICRLFGSCCSQDKEGKAVFKRCKFHTQPEIMVESLKFEAGEDEHIPVMEHYGIEMMSLEGNDQERVLLPEAVLNALDKINFYIEMLGINVDEISPSNPDDHNFPSPQAS